MAADSERRVGKLQLRQDPREEVLLELVALLGRAAPVPAGDQLELVVEHEHAGDRGTGRADQLAELLEPVELNLAEELGVRVVDQRLDVEDLLLHEVLHQRELALPGRGLAGVAVPVVGERDRRGQHREDQGIQEQDAAHGRGRPAI